MGRLACHSPVILPGKSRLAPIRPGLPHHSPPLPCHNLLVMCCAVLCRAYAVPCYAMSAAGGGRRGHHWRGGDPDQAHGRVQVAHRQPAGPPDLHAARCAGAAALVCGAAHQASEPCGFFRLTLCSFSSPGTFHWHPPTLSTWGKAISRAAKLSSFLSSFLFPLLLDWPSIPSLCHAFLHS